MHDDTPTEHSHNGVQFNVWPNVERERIILDQADPVGEGDRSSPTERNWGNFESNGSFETETELNGWDAYIQHQEKISGSVEHFDDKESFIDHVKRRIDGGILDDG